MAFIAAAIPMLATAAAGLGAAATAAAPAIGVGSAVLGGAGALMQGFAGASAANYDAAASKIQASTATNDAAFQASQIARQTRLKVAQAQAGGVENGFDSGGSMTTLTNAIQDTGELDKMLAVYDGSVRATGYQNQGALDSSQAGWDELGGFIGAGTKALGGISSAYH
jgi:hypothetical protein